MSHRAFERITVGGVSFSTKDGFDEQHPSCRALPRPPFLRQAPIPVPWNAELLFYLLVELVVGIMCFAYETVNAVDFLEVTKWTSAAYLVARGIAKAGRVLDERSDVN
jgi:hypothetical protein